VDVFDGEAWVAASPMIKGRAGTGLAVSCECGGQVHIAGGTWCNSCSDIETTETLFPNGTNVKCTAQTTRSLMEEATMDDKAHSSTSLLRRVRASE
jgi:hypothetical protein